MQLKLLSPKTVPSAIVWSAVGFIALGGLAVWMGYQFTNRDLEHVGEPVWLPAAKVVKPSPASLVASGRSKNAPLFQLAASPDKSSSSSLPALTAATPDPTRVEWMIRDDVVYGLWESSIERPLKPVDKPLTPPIWRIVGTAVSGTVSHALVVIEGQPLVQTVPVGGSLPTGEKILAVNQDYVTLQAKGSRLYLLLGR